MGVTLVVCGEGGVTEETLGLFIIETNSVDVEGVGASLPERRLHLSLLVVSRGDIVEPVFIRYLGDAPQSEIEIGVGIVLAQDVDLFLDFVISGRGRSGL